MEFFTCRTGGNMMPEYFQKGVCFMVISVNYNSRLTTIKIPEI